MKTPDTTPAGCCTNCGSTDMTLAVDRTTYSGCVFTDGQWKTTYETTQDSCADDAVRFFCNACGAPHNVPKDLK